MRELEERRAYLCRLTPDRALTDLDEAAEWIVDRGMVTITEDCSLPSLFTACHEEPYKPGAKGFGSWPKTKYWWSIALTRRPELVHPRLQQASHDGGHRHRCAQCHPERDCLADVLHQHRHLHVAGGRLARLEGEEQRLADYLAAAGPSLLEEVREELGVDAGALRRLRGRLEKVGAVVSREVVLEDPHRHTSELRRWDQLFPRPTRGGIEELVDAGVQAAVLAREDEVKRWFTWTVEPSGLQGLARPASGWVAAPPSA